jgi:cyclopropane-fatty-acyl-phospholipid synthase
MATRNEIEATYTYMDSLWRALLGDGADITCELFDGDYSKSLEQAQRD